MSANYFLVVNGKPQGPYSIAELKTMQVDAEAFLKTAEMDDYKEAHHISELREALGFAMPDVLPQYFAGFDQRLLASALDWFFIAGGCILLAFAASIFVEERATRLIIGFSLLGIIPAVKIIYHILMEISAKQGTFGKQILNIKVSDLKGNKLTLSRSLIRNLAKIISVIPFFTGYLFSFFNKQQQCMHDMIAGTLVIKDRLI
jgi:uncharacterized RDD family membrane protein YckC